MNRLTAGKPEMDMFRRFWSAVFGPIGLFPIVLFPIALFPIVLFLIALCGCGEADFPVQHRPVAAVIHPHFGTANPDDTYPVILIDKKKIADNPKSYANHCAASGLGYVPRFSCADLPYQIDTGITSGPSSDKALDQYDPTTFNQKCRRPAWLNDLSNEPDRQSAAYRNDDCSPGSRTGRIEVFRALDKKSGKGLGKALTDVIAIATCRRYWPEKTSGFHDINIIVHKPETGATCFFNSMVDGGVGKMWSGQDIVPPAHDDEGLSKYDPKAESPWLKPNRVANYYCHGCHDNDPFIQSPWILSAYKNKWPVGHRFAPYHAPGFKWKFRPHVLPNLWDNGLKAYNQKLKAANQAPVEACFRCHRITAANRDDMYPAYDEKTGTGWYNTELRGTCNEWLDAHTGHGAEPQQEKAPKKVGLEELITMPPRHGEESKEAYEKAYRPAIDFAKCCCKNPTWRGCASAPVGTYAKPIIRKLDKSQWTLGQDEDHSCIPE